MQKYKITNENKFDIAGRIRKFFKSCAKNDVGIYDFTCYMKDFTKLSSNRFWSIPSPCDVWCEPDGIYSDFPVSQTIPINSYVYFIGGNIIAFKIYCEYNNRYSEFMEVYYRGSYSKFEER